MSQDTELLFSISQAAKACNLSRSTLLRMEERGLLTPAYIAPGSNRRYYDNYNIARILQIKQFQSMGFDTKETAAYFSQNGEVGELLAILENKLHMLQRSVEEMRLRSMQAPQLSVEIIELPEMVCCIKKSTGLTVQEKYDTMYDFYHECICSGYVLAKEPLLVINERTDYLDGQISSTPYPYQVCVPVLPEKAPPDAIHFPACKALSVLYYGDYSDVESAWLTLGKEVKERGLTPIAFPRTLGIVAPYTGREINPERYCSRIALPVAL